ncbi:SPW repeat-containing protein [Methylobacterium tarhaniae]|uniref:SPW repeat-containing protein n=1 Tax=Methylobacterium tarhaniae TaxID=1187852 RepID=A0A0J6SWV2_9HYPH|nr:SPW repeat protein [Methylobacterium tarhaniae]KMO38012.1 SPW repeat-containing protein [Methylobacterium tarhaniae]
MHRSHHEPRWPPRTDEILLAAVQHAAGTALLVAAWVLIITENAAAAACALPPGLMILLLSGLDPARMRPAVEREVVILGVGTAMAPWLFGFAARDTATWLHVVLGAMAAGSAAARLRFARAP